MAVIEIVARFATFLIKALNILHSVYSLVIVAASAVVENFLQILPLIIFRHYRNILLLTYDKALTGSSGTVVVV